MLRKPTAKSYSPALFARGASTVDPWKSASVGSGTKQYDLQGSSSPNDSNPGRMVSPYPLGDDSSSRSDSDADSDDQESAVAKRGLELFARDAKPELRHGIEGPNYTISQDYTDQNEVSQTWLCAFKERSKLNEGSSRESDKDDDDDDDDNDTAPLRGSKSAAQAPVRRAQMYNYAGELQSRDRSGMQPRTVTQGSKEEEERERELYQEWKHERRKAVSLPQTQYAQSSGSNIRY